MPRSSGTYSAPPSSWSPAVSGNAATFGDFNTLLADLSDALTQSLSQDGQTNPTANLPMAGFKHTGAGNASGAGQYIVWGQACTLGAITGTTASFTTLTATDGSGIAALSASNLGSGTVPNARFPATLPAVSGANLTSLTVANLAAGTLPAGVTVPAAQLSGNVAAARISAAFVANNSSDGYVTLPNGTIFQWGSSAVGATTNLTVSLPITFPNSFLQPFASRDESSTAQTSRVGAAIVSTSQIQLQNPGSSTTIRYFAIGF